MLEIFQNLAIFSHLHFSVFIYSIAQNLQKHSTRVESNLIRMQSDFSPKLSFQTSEIEEARDVLSFSVIVQKSLIPLNLEGSERLWRRQSILTEESCRKQIEPRRKILYKYHLDLPKGLETSLRNANHGNTSIHSPVNHDDDCEDNYWAFHLKEMKVSDSVYNYGLEYGILDAIMFAEDQIEKLKQYLNTIKILKFGNSCVETANFLYDHILEVLHPNCNDSDLVMRCVSLFNFSAWVFDRENTRILKYVLRHAQHMRRDLWRTSSWGEDPINGCVYHLTFRNLGTLIKYGAPLGFQHEFYISRFSLGYPEERRISYVAQKAKTKERLLLLLQLFFVYMHSPQAVKRLRYIWRAIQEPYFSREEIISAFDGVIPTEQVIHLTKCYISNVCEELPFGMKVTPRSLQHLCRVAIRNSLNRNFQLPRGISLLKLPTILNSYLNIEL